MLLGIEYATGLLGLFLACPLMAMTRTRPANFWLGMFILSVSLLSLAFPVYARLPQLFGLFDWPLAGVGAFFYFYVRSMTGLGNSRRQLFHLIPLALLVCALAYGRSRLSGIDMLRLLLGEWQFLFSMLLLGIQVLAAMYAIAALYRLRQYRHRLREQYSSVERRELNWLSWLCISFIALLILWIPSNLLGGVWGLLLVLGRLLTLYFVGWFGLRQTAVFLAPAEAPRPVALPPEPAADKYARSGMTEPASRLIGQRLEHWVAQDRGYLDPDIKLTDLAAVVGTSPQLLSQYLNDVRGVSFFDYVNSLRVAEIQKLMRDRGNDGRTLLDLAFAAGFSSKSTFNASFKKITGVAPSSWRNEHARTSTPIG
jgi:AraC-like DNA-binding protein